MEVGEYGPAQTHFPEFAQVLGDLGRRDGVGGAAIGKDDVRLFWDYAPSAVQDPRL
jgi:hypothetical protein